MDAGTTVSEGYCKGYLSLSVVKKIQEYEILLRIYSVIVAVQPVNQHNDNYC